MKTLVKYELYKIFTQKSIYFVLFLLFALTTFFSSQMVGPPQKDLYSNWEGKITKHDVEMAKEKDEAIKQKQNDGEYVTWEENKLRSVYYNVMEVNMYQEYKQQIISQIKQQIDTLEDHSSYTYRSLNLKLDMMKDITYDSLYFQLPSEQMVAYLGTYGFVILGALILVGISPIFTEEATSGVYQQMLSSRNGRKTVVHAKLIASVILVLVITIVSVCFDFIFWNIAYGNDGWKADIQTINTFWESPYSFSMGTYFILKAGFQFITGCALAILVAFVSSLSRNSIASFIISGFVFGVPVLVSEIISLELPTFITTILKFSYSKGMMVDSLFENFHIINLFGYPILYPIVYMVWVVVLSVSLVFLTYRVLLKKQVY